MIKYTNLMESNYFVKLQKRYDELTNKGAALEYGN